jgi:chromosome partitioning protein
MQKTIDLVAERLNHGLRLSGIVFCMYDANTRLAIEVSADVEAFFQAARTQRTSWSGARTFQTRIRRNIRLAEAPSFGQSIFQYAPGSNGAEDYRQLAREILTVWADEASSPGVRAGTPPDAGPDGK